MLAASTLLDPRLKKVAFADVGAADQGVRHLTVEMTASENTDTREELNTSTESSENGTNAGGLWHAFDRQVAEMTSRRTPASDSMVEIRHSSMCSRRTLGGRKTHSCGGSKIAPNTLTCRTWQ